MHVSYYRSVGSDFLHHGKLRRTTLPATNPLDYLHFDCSRTVLVITALALLGFCSVRGALLSRNSKLLAKVAIQLGPAAIATLIHPVAIKYKLRRVLLVNIPNNRHPSLHGLNEAHGVAAATLALVPVGTQEVISIDICPVELLRELRSFYARRVDLQILPSSLKSHNGLEQTLRDL